MNTFPRFFVEKKYFCNAHFKRFRLKIMYVNISVNICRIAFIFHTQLPKDLNNTFPIIASYLDTAS